MMQLLPHPYQLIQHWSRNKSINQHRINGLAVTPTGRVVLACQVGNHHWGGLHWPRGGGGAGQAQVQQSARWALSQHTRSPASPTYHCTPCCCLVAAATSSCAAADLSSVLCRRCVSSRAVSIPWCLLLLPPLRSRKHAVYCWMFCCSTICWSGGS
jgi:hypothetical protein